MQRSVLLTVVVKQIDTIPIKQTIFFINPQYWQYSAQMYINKGENV